MHPTELLIQEHGLIERLLAVTDRLLTAVADGSFPRREVFQEITRFLEIFADGYHHKKEELELFPLLVECGFAKNQGPIAVMLLEHSEARSLTEQFSRAADRFARGDDTCTHVLIYIGQTYVDLLSRHICKENNVLFNLAKQILDEDDGRYLNKSFQAINDNVIDVYPYESFYNLVTKLEYEFPLTTRDNALEKIPAH